MWEDGRISSIEALLEGAEQAPTKQRAKELLTQALGSAKCIKDSYKRQNYVALIEDKLRDL
ncbi:MAG: hypothetical protein J6C82_05180 [Clostridia bacterium]|nr:hypothetical protein [Clostridia bacterium]